MGARRTSWTLDTFESTSNWGTIATVASAITEALKRSMTSKSTSADSYGFGSIALVEVLEFLSSHQFLLAFAGLEASDPDLSSWLIAQDLLTIMSSGQMRLLYGMNGEMNLLVTSLEGLMLAMDESWLIIGLLMMPCAGESSEGRKDSEFLEHFAGGCFQIEKVGTILSF